MTADLSTTSRPVASSTTPPTGPSWPARLAEGPIALYDGFDPTADSLHVGNLIGLLVLRRFQTGGAPADRPRRRRHRHDRRPERALRGAQPPRRRDAPAQHGEHQGADGRFSTSAEAPRGASSSTTATGPSRVTLLDSSATWASTSRSTRWSPGSRCGAGWRASTGSRTPSSATCCCRPTTSLAPRTACVLQIGGSDQWGNITRRHRPDPAATGGAVARSHAGR